MSAILSYGNTRAHSNTVIKLHWMGDYLGTPSAAGRVSDINAALVRMESV